MRLNPGLVIVFLILIAIKGGAAAAADSSRDIRELAEVSLPSRTRNVLPKLDDSLFRSALPASFILMKVELQNSTVLDSLDIDALAARFMGRTVDRNDLEAIRYSLSAAYLAKGYLGSGVVLPDQAVTDGVVTMRAVELRLSGIDVQSENISADYLRRQLERDVGSPLSVARLEKSLRKLQNHPLISSVQARLVDGLDPGASRLLMDVTPNVPYEIQLKGNNFRPPSIGSEQGVVLFTHRNLTGHRDTVEVQAAMSDGVNSGYIAYDLPINLRDSKLQFSYQLGDSTVVEEPFDSIDIESETERFRFGIVHPLYQSLERSLLGSLSLVVSDTETTLLGDPFSFSLGAVDGETRTAVLEIGGEYTKLWDNHVLSTRLTWREGLDLFSATENSRAVDLTTGADIPNGQFSAVLAQVNYAHNLNWLGSQVNFQATYQHAFDPLLVSEKASIGGFYSVRGYRENSLVRDTAAYARFEWRVPVFGSNNLAGSIKNLWVIPFADTGWAKDKNDELSSGRGVSITSMGVGVEWLPTRFVSLRAYYGESLDDEKLPDPSDRSLQDDGIHVEVALRWPAN